MKYLHQHTCSQCHVVFGYSCHVIGMKYLHQHTCSQCHVVFEGFPLSAARGKDGPFIPCYASLPLEVPKAGGNKEDKTSLHSVVRGVHP